MTIPENLLTYMREREKARMDEFTALMESLSPREQSLIREAAVMGFVHGTMAAGGIPREHFPKDSEITQRVVEGCRSMSDLYPTIGEM